MRNQILMVTNIQWPSGFVFFFFLNIPVPKQTKKSAYYKTPTLQEYTIHFFINLTLQTTENGSKEEGLPQS